MDYINLKTINSMFHYSLFRYNLLIYEIYLNQLCISSKTFDKMSSKKKSTYMQKKLYLYIIKNVTTHLRGCKLTKTFIFPTYLNIYILHGHNIYTVAVLQEVQGVWTSPGTDFRL